MGRALFTISPRQVSDRLQSILSTLGVSPADCVRYTTHCFRRGAGVDVLEAQKVACTEFSGDRWKERRAYGPVAMLHMGEWASSTSAVPYASRDEQIAVSMAMQIAEASDDDN